MAGKYNLQIDQGATYLRELQYTDENDNPIDLTDYSVRMQIRANFADFNDSELYLSISSSISASSTESGFSLTGLEKNLPTTSGSLGLFISATDTDTFNFSEGVYDIELDNNGEVTRLLEGKVLVNKSVTR